MLQLKSKRPGKFNFECCSSGSRHVGVPSLSTNNKLNNFRCMFKWHCKKNMNVSETSAIIKVEIWCSQIVRNKHHAPVKNPITGTGSSSFSVLSSLCLKGLTNTVLNLRSLYPAEIAIMKYHSLARNLGKRALPGVLGEERISHKVKRPQQFSSFQLIQTTSL